MILKQYPSATLNVACTKCHRRGRYAVYRLVHRWGNGISCGRLLEYISSDCPKRQFSKVGGPDFCGAYLEELRPPEKPQIASAMDILKNRHRT